MYLRTYPINIMIDRVKRECDLLKRHVEILQVIDEMEPVEVYEISDRLDIPHHQVRYSLQILQHEGLTQTTDEGTVTSNRTEEFWKNLDDEIDEVVDMLKSIE